MHINIKSGITLQKGISLIELVIFIVILSVALTGITLLYLNTTRYSADAMVRIRSIELAQSTLEEILLKSYDHNTPIGGGCVQFTANSNCPNAGSNPDALVTTLVPATITPVDLSSTEEGDLNRSVYNDVDDYHNKLYCGDSVVAANTACPTLTCQNMENAPGNNISPQYSGFSVCIQVSFAGGAGTEINNITVVSGTANTSVLTNDAKRIDVTITDPLNTRIGLSAYRLNF